MKRLDQVREDDLVSELIRHLPAGSGTLLAAGDDCAVLKAKLGSLLVYKTDCIVEGVHYLPEDRPALVARKALCRNLSDIAAMGGVPRWALVTVLSPPEKPVRYWTTFYRGLGKTAREFGLGIVGGEVSRSRQAAISVAMIGELPENRYVTRMGGRAGDRIFVTGKLGGSFASRRHLTFTPRLKEGQWLAEHRIATAMMDLSDGLGSDLPRLARLSRCGYSITPEALPRRRGCSIDQAIRDGEDYELLFTVPPRRVGELREKWPFPKTLLTEIGALTRSTASKIPPGFDHFFHCQPAEKRAS
ncbi:thiamine-phosphate kinase [Spartobacteria bacterium LR76]|nr:thiamine-phosphate kinase [Spartobacteria bacterium LR76]